MKTEELHSLWEKYDDEFLKFDQVENKRCKRPDLHAFLLLDEILPGDGDMVTAAEHDEIFLDIDLEQLAAVITEAQCVELIRCGVRYSGECDCLALFV